MRFQNYVLKVNPPIVAREFSNLSNQISEINILCESPHMLSTNNILQQSITPKKIIFNNPATIVIWSDGSKTVSKCNEEDKYDKVKGFLVCYYKKHEQLSNSKFSKLYDKILENDVIEF